MSPDQPVGDPQTQRIDYDPEVVITRLAGQLTAAYVEAARFEAIVRTLAGQNAALHAQVEQLQRTAPAGGEAGA